MTLDTTGLDNRIFAAFSETSSRRYIYVSNLQTNVSRWSKNAVDYFGLEDEYVYNFQEFWNKLIHPDDFEAYNKVDSLAKHVNDCYSIQRVLYSYCLIKWIKMHNNHLTEQEIFEKHFGGVVNIDENTNKALSIKRIYLR